MGKLTFYYGVMGCSKTANALMTRFNYLEHGKSVLFIKPAIDNRDDKIVNGEIKTIVKSRIGIEAEASIILPTDRINCNDNIDIIICDEAQFLTASQVEDLKNLSQEVICYGLRTDFKTNLFSGSKRLFELADSIIELPAICECGNRAEINMRIDANGKIILDGDQIDIGGNEKYKAICWNCYQEKIKQKEENV